MGNDCLISGAMKKRATFHVGRRIVLHSAVALGIIMFAFGAGMASEITMDRSWWNDTIPEASRVWVVAGMTDAFGAGYSAGVGEEDTRILREAGAVLPASSVDALKAVAYRQNNSGSFESTENAPTFSRTFGFYEAAITDYYNTHPSANTSIGWIMGCLADNPQLSCDQLATFR
jgi:hypothetical protein